MWSRRQKCRGKRDNISSGLTWISSELYGWPGPGPQGVWTEVYQVVLRGDLERSVKTGIDTTRGRKKSILVACFHFFQFWHHLCFSTELDLPDVVTHFFDEKKSPWKFEAGCKENWNWEVVVLRKQWLVQRR